MTPLENIARDPSKPFVALVNEELRKHPNLKRWQAWGRVAQSKEGQTLIEHMHRPALPNQKDTTATQVVILPSALVQKLQASLSVYSTVTSAANLKELIALLKEALTAAGG